jgi:hypothetical protein
MSTSLRQTTAEPDFTGIYREKAFYTSTMKDVAVRFFASWSTPKAEERAYGR